MDAKPRRRIVLVDDNQDDLLILRRLLDRQQREYEIIAARSGAEGLRLVDEVDPDCTLVDFFLPDTDGAAFIDALRARHDGVLPNALIVVTGQASDDLATRSLKGGAQDHLVKDGLTSPALVRAIENAIEKYQIQQDLEQSRATLEVRNRKLEVLREKLEEKVRELATATKAKDQFMAVMSHEMRTPLNAIIGYTELLEMELDGELTAGQREQVKRIQVGSRHLLDLINDVLDLARADANRLEIDVRPVSLDAVLDEVVTLLDRQAREKGLELSVTHCESGPLVEADLNRLRQILTNLIGNAIKFTESGSVSTRCEVVESSGRVRVHVTDTGIGIEPDVLGLVFTEFYQARGELTREKGGSGLGLAISRRLARLMGGEITADSEPGRGSTFTLELRAATRDARPREEDAERHEARMDLQAAMAAEGAAGPVTVVAFSGNTQSLEELEKQVLPGVRMVWTGDPAALVDLAVGERAALVVLDVSSLDERTWDAVHSIQERRELGESAILLLPSLPEPTGKEAAGGFQLGWLSLVPKPFTADQLRHAVSAAAKNRQTQPESDERYSVLVVDDDPDSRRVASTFLSEASLDVREAPDGESALVAMRRSRPDVVVLDLMMPVLDGFGVLATMRADPELVAVPVVVLTAKSLTEAERRFLARSTVRVLQKGEHRLADVAALVLRAAARARVEGD